jgi:hypothetical protein
MAAEASPLHASVCGGDMEEQETFATGIDAAGPTALERTAGARQAYHLLHVGYAAAPILAGLDKFFELLVDWEQYLAPQLARSPRARRRFMRTVGGVEIVAGALVAAKPRLGSWIVAGWLGGIIGNLLLGRRSYDVALRDLGLMIGAIALARLSSGRAQIQSELH